MDTCPTVRIKSDNEQGFCIIDEHAFDVTKHELFDAPVKKTETKQPEGGNQPAGNASNEPDLEKMNKGDLQAHLESNGIEYDPDMNKSELLEFAKVALAPK